MKLSLQMGEAEVRKSEASIKVDAALLPAPRISAAGRWMAAQRLVSKRTVIDGLELPADAFIGVLSGANIGKMLVRLADASSGMKRRSGLVNR